MCLLLTVVKFRGPRLSHVIPSTAGNTETNTESVTAVTLLDEQLFIMRSRSPHVDVYDATTCTFKGRIMIPGLGISNGGPLGLAVCAVYQCIYASDLTLNMIHRVDLTEGNAVKEWSVGTGPRGLSVNHRHNVVVVCSDCRKIQEYTTHGTLVREIDLKNAVTEPWHAVQLSTGEYVVSDCTSLGAVIVVGANGRLVRGYHSLIPEGLGQTEYPRSLVVTKYDDILVADANRIFSLTSFLRGARKLALPVDGGIQLPCGLCLGNSRGRLYIGEGGGQCRVLVFDAVRL